MITQEQLELRKKWIAALRSGEYKQCKGALFDGEGYCCLGVACVVAGLQPTLDNGKWVFEVDGSIHNLVLPPKVKDMFGIKHVNGGYFTINKCREVCLASDNDEGDTFDQIADTIETNSSLFK